MGVSPQYHRGRRIQRHELVRLKSRRRADRGTSAAVDPNHHLRESRTMVDSVRDDRICRRQFRSGGCDPTCPAWPAQRLGALFIIAIYGGYFGGGIGFLMLAAFTLFGMRDINAMNGLKMGLVGVMTTTAIVTLIAADVVRWPQTLPMLASSAVGSYMAAHWAQRLDQRLIKGFVIVLGAGLTVYFVWRGV